MTRPKRSSSLGKLLTSNSGKHDSLIFHIDVQNNKKEPVYNNRQAVNLAKNFLTALTEKGRDGSMIEFFELMQMYFAPDARDIENIHPSELHKACPRALYYRLTKVEPTNKITKRHDAKTQRIFDVGSWFHWYIQIKLYKAGVLKSHEVGFFNKTLKIIGHTDGIVILSGTEYILEIKTINRFQYGQIVQRNEALPQHVHQASIYAKELGIPLIYFLYIEKDSCSLFERVYTEKEFKEYQDLAYEKVYSIHDSIDEGVPPDRPCASPLDDAALNCKYCNHCFNLNK